MSKTQEHNYLLFLKSLQNVIMKRRMNNHINKEIKPIFF